MQLSSTIAALAAFVSVATALPSKVSSTDSFGAVYMITNDLDANYVVAAEIGQDGLLSNLNSVSAQGSGAQGQPINLGPLFSQGPVEVNQATGRLAVVNAGSNTFQIFDIDAENPTTLTPVGDAVESKGDFPESLAWNTRGDKLCVLNGGVDSSVQCYTVDESGAATWASTGAVSGYNQTANPPTGPPGTVSQVFFTPDQENVVAIVKGLRTDFDTYPGFLRVWDINDDAVLGDSPTTIEIRPPYGGLTFSLSQIPGREAYVGSDVVNGALVVDMTNGVDAAVIKPLTLPNNAGNCWSVAAPKTGTYFISDLLASYINEVKVDDDLNPTLVRQYSVPGAGPNEAVVADVNGQEFLYIMHQANSSFGVWRLDGPGEAELVQLMNITIPIENQGTNVDYILLSGMSIYLKE
ncbi:hypothetical protein PENSPDRAFT_666176 [Peniophora sp. CONT]|nr:hypothetical protein PENSPDRAFT_666176 [Peniophora sp. CONT]